MDILRFGLDVKCCACTNVMLMPQLQCHFHYTAGTTWKWRWRLTSRQPRCCSSGSLSSCCRTWTLFPKRSTSTWSSTIMTRVRQVFDTPYKQKQKNNNNTTYFLSVCSYLQVTPEDYQPPGFKEGDCDRLWFEGTAVHFRVGEVPTNFHSLKLQISTEQGRLESIKKGGFVQTDTVLQGNHSGIKVGPQRHCYFALISSAFKILILIKTLCYRLLLQENTAMNCHLKMVSKCTGAHTK